MSGIEEHLAAAQPLLDRWGYAAVFAAVFVEGVGIPAPGQTLLMAGCALAARGEMSLGLVLASGALAAATGNAAGFALGHWGGRRLLERFGAGPRLERIEARFARRADTVVLLGRFVDGVRQINGIAAGALGMPGGRFLLVNALGALLWTGFWGLGTWWLESDFAAIARVVRRLGPGVRLSVAVAAAAVVVWVVRGRRARGTPRARDGA